MNEAKSIIIMSYEDFANLKPGIEFYYEYPSKFKIKLKPVPDMWAPGFHLGYVIARGKYQGSYKLESSKVGNAVPC